MGKRCNKCCGFPLNGANPFWSWGGILKIACCVCMYTVYVASVAFVALDAEPGDLVWLLSEKC